MMNSANQTLVRPENSGSGSDMLPVNNVKTDYFFSP